MTEDHLVLAGEFSSVGHDKWLTVVEKALKGAPFDKKLVTRLYEGIALQPIYSRSDWSAEGDPSGFPGQMPFTRGGAVLGSGTGGWDIRQLADHPDPAAANASVTADLEHGVTSLLVRLDAAGRAGTDAAAGGDLAGCDGVMVYSVADLDALFAGIDLRLVPVALSCGAAYLAGPALLAALWRRRGLAAAETAGAFNADPLGALAATGRLNQPLERALAETADLAVLTARTWPRVTAIGVDTTVYHGAGATESQDLGIALATGVAYLRALTAAGLGIDQAAGQIAFTLATGCDQFLAIAKLRAVRKLWARVVEACGGSEPARTIRSLHAITATRILTKRDPWVNMLRATVATFAAGVAGADSVTTLPFDSALGSPDGFSRRIARNIQIILQEESSLARVVDPAGGSWYVETLTDQLARAAWAEFQAIEKAGGIAAGLADGSIAARIAGSWAERAKNLAKRKDPVTGVSEFPNIQEKPVVPAVADLATLRQAAKARLVGSPAVALAAPGGGALAESAIGAALAGASLGRLAAGEGSGAAVTPLPQHRLAEEFEALRDAADRFRDRTGARPAIFLANLGRIAQHTGRATFAKNFFEAGGIETIPNDGFSDPAEAAAAFKASGARIAILCGTDTQYEEMSGRFGPALKQAGAGFLFQAGHPGDKKPIYQSAGVDEFIFLGGDALATLRQTLVRLGVIA